MIKINDKTLKALKEQLETIQENGIYNVGFSLGIFDKIPADELLWYAEKAIQKWISQLQYQRRNFKRYSLTSLFG